MFLDEVNFLLGGLFLALNWYRPAALDIAERLPIVTAHGHKRSPVKASDTTPLTRIERQPTSVAAIRKDAASFFIVGFPCYRF